MDFQRARSKEQKDIRKEEIISVACSLYSQMPYDKITMSSISKQLSFTRGNLYKYASTKEEIFLLVIIADQKSFTDDIIIELNNKQNLSFEQFGEIWAKTIYKHKRLLSLYSLMFNIIEKNVSLEKLTQFKVDFFKTTYPVYQYISKALPNLCEQAIFRFYTMQFHYLRGLYPACQDTKVQKEAIIQSGIPYTTPDFVEEFTYFVVMVLKSQSQQ